MDLTKLALVGFADDMMYKLADVLRKRAAVEVSVVVDGDEMRGIQAAEKYSADYISDIDEAINDYDLNGLCIGSEIERRREKISAAVEHRTPLLCLNPVAKTIEETKTVLNSVRENDVKFYAPFQLRYYERFQQLREMMIKEGRKLGSLHCTLRSKPRGSGDIISELGIHVLDLIRWFTRLEVQEVYAEIGGRTQDIDQTENVLMLMKFNSEAFASAELSYSFQEDLYLNATYDDLFLQIKPLKQSVFLKGSSASMRYPWNIDPLEYMVEEFLDYLSHDKAPSITSDDVYRASLLASSARQSLGNGSIKVAF
jgi:predicted dehydrogenase